MHLADELWNRSVEVASRTPPHHGFFSGLAGLGWVATQLDELVYEGSDPETFRAIDTHLSQVLRDSGDRLPLDPLTGLVGIGMYALERPGDADGLLDTTLREILSRTVWTRDGATWPIPPEHMTEVHRRAMPGGCYNLGVAHGTPGLLVLLARSLSRDSGRLPIRRALEEGVRWLLSTNRPPSSGHRFPPFRGLTGRIGGESRLAWCYGDLGVACALSVSARCAGRSDWALESRSLGLRCAATGFEESGVADAGLCHGASGVAHLFRRLARAHRDPDLSSAGDRWHEHALRMQMEALPDRHPERPIPPRPERSEPGLLTGGGGVLLSLASSLTDEDFGWDRFLFLSCRDEERKA